jgi:acyl-CoA thioesterase
MSATETARKCADRMYANDAASRGLGIEVEIPMAGRAVATMTVLENMVNGLGVCHGGHIFALADTAFAFACNGYDNVTVAAGATVDFLRPVRAGDRLTAAAFENYRGRRSGVYDVTVTNQDGRQVATFRGRAHATGTPLLPPAD